ncbi:MAG: small ribosomal subunit Rsm22 family protein [Alphaproteobacteria bacterium]
MVGREGLTLRYLPAPILKRISALIDQKTHLYQSSYNALSRRYRNQNDNKKLLSQSESLAYLLARLPATTEVLGYAFEQVKKLTTLNFSSYLDIGCGPGASYWVAKDLFPSLCSFSFLEANPFMYDLLVSLIEKNPSIEFFNSDARKVTFTGTHDLVSFSYSLGEMDQQQDVLDKYWNLTTKALIITEPGTPVGFKTLLNARKFLINSGAFIVAPCGHNAPCPLENAPKDWCHFSTRLERSPVHKTLKKSTLAYEDEKFVYLIATKEPFAIPGLRILKRPLKGKGHVRLDLCTPEGIEKRTVSKSKAEEYKECKTKEWGDLVE